MLTVEEAARTLQSCVTPITQTERVPLLEAMGRVLAKDAKAFLDQPPFPRSPLDGYAIKGEDSKGAGKEHPVLLKVIGEVWAGQVFPGTVEKGQAVRIMTGAPIPEGADTVIKQEDTDYGEELVRLYGTAEPWSNYCFQGEDYHKGDILLKKGTLLDAVSVGILAGMGVWEVEVFSPLGVGIISTGDELIAPGSRQRPGTIYNSNLYLLGARLKELGVAPSFLLHCEDDEEQMAELIRQNAGKADLILTTGGVSVGKRDIMHQVVKELSAKQLFWKVALKPGGPVLAALWEQTLLLCLSGNPFGTLANFELLARPVLAALSGNLKLKMEKKQAVFQCDFSKSSPRRRFLRGYYQDGKVWIPEKRQESGILSTMAGCNCLLDIREGNPGLRKGDTVWVHLL